MKRRGVARKASSPPIFELLLRILGQPNNEESHARRHHTQPRGPGHLSILRPGQWRGHIGANIFRDVFAGIRDIVGGRSAAYEEELRKAKNIALDEMQAEAARLGGNAVVGVDLDYETITMGSGGGMLMVTASGTAVLVK